MAGVQINDLRVWLVLAWERCLPPQQLKGPPSASTLSSRTCNRIDDWECGTGFWTVAASTCSLALLQIWDRGNSWDTLRTRREIPCKGPQQVWTFSFRWFFRISAFWWRPWGLAKAESPGWSTWGRSPGIPCHPVETARCPNERWCWRTWQFQLSFCLPCKNKTVSVIYSKKSSFQTHFPVRSVMWCQVKFKFKLRSAQQYLRRWHCVSLQFHDRLISSQLSNAMGNKIPTAIMLSRLIYLLN